MTDNPAIQELDIKNTELAEAQRIASLGFWRWEPASGKFIWSDEIFRLLGRDPAVHKVTVESTFDCIHPDDRAATMAKLEATVTNKAPQSHQYRAIRADGEVLYFWSSTRPILDAYGTVTEVRGIVQEISGRVHAEGALRESEDHYRHAVELNPQIPWTADADGNVTEIAPRWCELIGMSQQEALGQGWSKAVHVEDRDIAMQAWRSALDTGTPLDIEYRVRRRDGAYNWMRVRAAPRRNDQGRVFRWYGTLEDIQRQKAAELALKESEARLAAVLESTGDCVVVVDRKWRITYRNRKALAAAAVPGSLQLGMPLWEALPIPPDTGFRQRLEAVVKEGQPAEFETFVPGPNIWFEIYAVPGDDGLSLFFRDVTEARKARDKITYLAHHDALTGLPNRVRFQEQLALLLSVYESGPGSVAVIYLDLDNFKDINDTLGHDAGDTMLREVASRLELIVPGCSSRIGGDEFAVLQYGDIDSPALERLSTIIRAALSEPVLYAGTELSCRASLGIAIYPDSDPRASEVLKNADLALYEAKSLGGNRTAFFSPKVRQRVQDRVSALACARDALIRDAIHPFYQPKVSLATGELYGFEALLRWTHARHGVQSPGLIKEAFDDPTLSVEIGRRMLIKVIEDMQKWRDAGVPFGSVAVNAAGQQFLRTDFAGEVLDRLKRADLPSRCLEIEITESVFLGEGSDDVGDALQKLHQGGVSISLDDFGTGYASLTHLNKFPLSWIKIDQSFVRDMSKPESAAIVNAVIGLAHNLGMQVVAEGVETASEWQQLHEKGADLAQGYLVAKPMAGSRVPHFIRTWAGTDNPSGALPNGRRFG